MSPDASWTPFDPEGESLPGDLALPRGDEAPMLVLLAGSTEEENGWAPRAALGVVRGWARAGFRVVLADLALDAPTLHALLGEENGEGITDALLYGASVQRIARRPQGEAFALIPAGTPVSDPAGVLGHPRWGSLAAGFREAGVILALYLPAALPGAGVLARRVALRVLLGPGGESLGPAPVLARLRPSGVVEGAGFVEEEFGEEQSEAPRLAARRIPSIPASRMAPAPVPALHRWAGAAGDGSGFGADLPEDFTASAGLPSGVTSAPEPLTDAPGTAEAGSEGPVVDPDSDRTLVEDPFAGLTLAPELPVGGSRKAEEMAVGWGGSPDAPEGEGSPDAGVSGEWEEEGGADAVAPLQGATAPPVEPGPEVAANAPPEVPSAAAPRQAPTQGLAAEPARRSPLGLLFLLLLLLLAVLGAARLGFISIPGLTPNPDPGSGIAPGTSTAQAAEPRASSAVPAAGVGEAPGGERVPVSSGHAFALALNAYSTAAGARAAARRLREALPAHPVVVAPVEVSGQTFHRLLVAGAAAEAEAEGLRGVVAPAFPQGDPAEWIVREARLGFLLAEAPTEGEAARRVAEAEQLGVPAYVLEVEFGDGTLGWRVHSGAYASEAEASTLAALLRDAGQGSPPLVPLLGRPPA